MKGLMDRWIITPICFSRAYMYAAKNEWTIRLMTDYRMDGCVFDGRIMDGKEKG